MGNFKDITWFKDDDEVYAETTGQIMDDALWAEGFKKHEANGAIVIDMDDSNTYAVHYRDGKVVEGKSMRHEELLK